MTPSQIIVLAKDSWHARNWGDELRALAANRFAAPLAMAPVWVPSTCYLAQVLIMHNARLATSEQRAS